MPLRLSRLRAATLAIVLIARGSLALGYVDSSPAGAFPDWESGRTEFTFADLDGDGNADFVTMGDHLNPYGSSPHGILAYMGDGAGGWSILMTGNLGYGGCDVGDVNGDGLMDVGYGIHHNYSGTDLGDQLIEVALGDGSASNWTPWDDGLAGNGEDWGMFATELADFDLDGDLDLASLSFGCCNGLHVYLNGGDGSWAQSWFRGGGNTTPFLCTGDVNGDGAPDLAAGHDVGTVWLNDGEGAFTSADAGLPAAGSLHGVSLGDADGDGDADLGFGRSAGLSVYAWRGDHWESISDGLPTTGTYDITQLWDMDLDGNLDLVALQNGAGSVWLGDGAGHWTSGGTFTHGAAANAQALATGGDIDHNGYPDLVMLVEEGSWPSYHNELFVFRESSTPVERHVHWQFPRGGETFVQGSAVTLHWSAAQMGIAEARIGIALSTDGPDGPWTTLATELPDGGHWQWTVGGEATGQAHLRITLYQEYEEVSAMTGAFTIVASGSTAVGDGGPAWTAPARLRALNNPSFGAARFAVECSSGLPESARLCVYDVSGRRLRALRPGDGHAVWDLRDEQGRRQPAGLYLARLEGLPGPAPATRFVLLTGN